MSDIFELEIFSTISGELIELSNYITENQHLPVEIHGSPTISGIIGLAFIESALIELGFKYHRSFRNSENVDENILTIIVGDMTTNFTPITVDLHMGHENSERNGVLDTIAQIGAFALYLHPSGKTKELEPWLISGSWLRSTLDIVYNPIYTLIRDYLRGGGAITVVCIPEVSEIDGLSVPGMNLELLSEARKTWQDLDFESKSELMSTLAKPLLSKGSLSVQRIEELCWHRILANDWSLDLASQCSIAARELSSSGDLKLSASRMLDELLSKGNLQI